ncbi:hypothetical protein RND81_03G070700 [Saponaria officinalis]|uniref:DUF4408 domain-containing protein n=1 Tax=Saponaria officinalis TaxID=3572 RepID=A0AAW1M392_SAPOF
MDTIYEIDSIKIEKQKAMRRYKTFRKIANIVRILEIFVAILLVSIRFSRTSSYIPAMLNYSGVFLRRLSSILFSPHFVFVISNVIIILFVNSGDHSPENVDVSVGEIVVTPSTELAVVEKEEEEEEEEVVEKEYRRSKSTSMVKAEVAEVVERRELRRSATLPRRKVEERRRCEEDELSNEEFNRKVEEFIEKKRMFLSEETEVLV